MQTLADYAVNLKNWVCHKFWWCLFTKNSRHGLFPLSGRSYVL